MNIIDFMSGATTLGFIVAGLFFLRFWKRAGDRFFLAFGLAFWLMAANQIGFSMFGSAQESAAIYLLRVIGYGLIIAAIVGKNIAIRK